jgi:mono/diheme cytochrome c family protein
MRPRPVPRDMLAVLAAMSFGPACNPPPEPPGPAAAAAARDLFRTRCANCHGPDGRGNGPSGRALDPAPRDFHDPAWQARVTDDHLRRTIVEGGHAVGLSPDMAANLDLDGRPAVVDELVAIVRGFARR